MTRRPSPASRAVCLFGTSGDPPTGDGGHRGVVSHLASLEEFDEVRVLPVYRHMFATKRGRRDSAGYDDRLSMCRLAFGDVPKVSVSDAERRCFERAVAVNGNGGSSEGEARMKVGTADVLDMLKEGEPDTRFTLALGSDTFMDLTDGKWRRWEDVVSHVEGRIVVIQRKFGENNGSTRDSQVMARLAKINLGRSPDLGKEVGIAADAANEIEQIGTYQHTHSATLSVDATQTQTEEAKPCQSATQTGKARAISIPALAPISSTFVRSTTDEHRLMECITLPVLKYIRDNKLYAFAEAS